MKKDVSKKAKGSKREREREREEKGEQESRDWRRFLFSLFRGCHAYVQQSRIQRSAGGAAFIVASPRVHLYS